MEKKKKIADNHAKNGASQTEALEKVNRTFREEITGPEEAATHARKAKKIAKALLGEEDFLSQELKVCL